MRDLPGIAVFWAFPLWVIFSAAAVYGADTPAASLFLSTLLLVFAIGLSLVAKQPPWPILAGGVLVAALTAYAFGQGWWSQGAHEYAALAATGAVFWCAFAGARTSRRADRLWFLTLLAGGLLALAAFVDFLVSPELNFSRARPYHLDRLSAPFLSANTAATFYASVALLAAGETLRRLHHVDGLSLGRIVERGMRKLMLPGLLLVFAISAVFLTASRAGIALIAVLLPLLVVWDVVANRGGRESGNAMKAGLVWGGAALGLVAAAFFLSGDLFSERLQVAGEDGTRSMMLQAYWSAAQDNLWTGTGLGSFEFVSDRVSTPDNATFMQFQGAAHNLYLQWVLQAGLTGAAGMLAVAGSVFVTLLAGLRRRRRQRTYLRTLIIIMLLFAGHGLVDYAVEIPMVSWWLAWIAGLGCGIATRQEQA